MFATYKTKIKLVASIIQIGDIKHFQVFGCFFPEYKNGCWYIYSDDVTTRTNILDQFTHGFRRIYQNSLVRSYPKKEEFH